MPEYNIGFAEKLIEAARIVAASSASTLDGQRTILYLSLLSSEITLKAFLESVGVPIQEIKSYSHNHRELLTAICHCEVFDEINPGHSMWVPASRVCAIPVAIGDASSTIGTILTSELDGASRYPNEIRYGESISHVPAVAVLQASEKLYEWTIKFKGAARRKQPNENSKKQNGTKTNRNNCDMLDAVMNFCRAYGGGLQVGKELRHNKNEQNEQGQDYWIGYELIDYLGNNCGEISAGYIRYIADFRIYAAIKIDEETFESETLSLDKISKHEKENNEKPKELKELIIKIAERATRKVGSPK